MKILVDFLKGVPMSKRTFYKWANLIVFLVAVIGLLIGIKVEGILANSVLMTIFWVIVGLWFGLTAYLGQGDEYQSWFKTQEKIIDEWRNKVNALEKELAQLKGDKDAPTQLPKDDI